MNSRRKGANGERELAKKLRAMGFNTKRDGNQGNGDAGDHPDVSGIEGMHIECKRAERLSLYDAYAQAKHDALEGEVPVVMHRKNNHEWMAILALDDFIEIWRESR